ncbi:hypothetical protein LF1_36890 [Rubripirellula obstinata]|uniref:Uncharacterized protein n=1 Tax=Rubripirellula obstinata TaxID=406547 RepID=A0A5B1CML3_9BACT|nr:hypothetical protein [Rubripirellula obstinata]KAA1261145.1 hypothetical protein LF1_36890 [Rubripirellula obstinata]
MTKLLLTADVDRRLAWPLGRAERLARRGKLPHLVLPDGSIRFRWRDIAKLVQTVATAPKSIDDQKAVDHA